jgi:hypothetical protein
VHRYEQYEWVTSFAFYENEGNKLLTSLSKKQSKQCIKGTKLSEKTTNTKKKCPTNNRVQQEQLNKSEINNELSGLLWRSV